MTVALDATPLSVPTGGIRRYVAELHRALTQRFPSDHWLLLSDQLTPPGDWWHRRWWLNGLRAKLLEAHADLFHGTDFAVPYRRACPAVMTIHDLSPWRYPHGSARVRQRVPWLLRTGRATRVITPSEAIRREVIARFHLKPDHVHAIPLAAAGVFTRQNTNKPARAYLLTVGALEPRKGLLQAIDAWRPFKATHDLVIVGRDQGVRGPQEDGLRYTGAISDQELAHLYTHAAAFLFPSEYEGFGLPVLEAMHCGAPVVISADPALLETAGTAAQVASTGDEWIEAIARAIEHPDPEPGFQRARQFSWQRTAELHHEVYQLALRSH